MSLSDLKAPSEPSRKKINFSEINTSDGNKKDLMSMESKIEKELSILLRRELLNLTAN